MSEDPNFEKALTQNPAISGDLAHSAGKTEANPVNGIAVGEKTFPPAIHERKYPREWFRVSRYFPSPEPRQFQRETEHMLFTGMDRYKKHTDSERWYPTLEEAQAASDKIKAAQADLAQKHRIRDAAPELLEALKRVADAYGFDPSIDSSIWQEVFAAITKAEG